MKIKIIRRGILDKADQANRVKTSSLLLHMKQNFDGESGGGDYLNVKQNPYPLPGDRINNNNDIEFDINIKDEQKLDEPISSQINSQQNSASKGFSFVSVVLEPNKKGNRSMKKRDKTKPLIENAILQKQVLFQNRLVEYQRQMNQSNQPSALSVTSTNYELEDIIKSKYDGDKSAKLNHRKISPLNEKKNSIKQQQISKVQRGNMGFCPLDMSLINLCGVPSLWMHPQEYVGGGSKIISLNSKGIPVEQIEPYIKPFQKKLLKKQYKVYELLRFHKIFENEKYFGKSISHMHSQQDKIIFQDYYYFTNECMKDNKYAAQLKNEMLKDNVCVLNLVQSSVDVLQIDLPKIVDPEPAFFKLVNAEAKLLKSILHSHGIQQTDQNEWNLLWTCVSLQSKPQIYEQLHDHQKINHFQNSTELTRKDRFAYNIQQMKKKYGNGQFDFAPETYNLPEEQREFNQRFNQISKQIEQNEEVYESDYGSNKSSEELFEQLVKEDNFWIVKPSQSSQGKGIYIIDNLNDIQINPGEKCVVSKYISNPLLINNHKFDLRIYVLVTSLEPLRIYIYNEGLVRFAAHPYNNTKNVKNLFSHLTNYSINKKSEQFQQNKSVFERDVGNKWSLSALQSHFESMGINMQLVWERMYDAIIKSIISVENSLLAGVKRIQNQSSRHNCFELFGFDILLDSNFKPHILEVNFSPSLSADSPLDYHIKSSLLIDTLNLVGIKRNPKKRGTKNLVGAQRFRGASVNINNQGNNNQSKNYNGSSNQSMGFIQMNINQSKQRESKGLKSSSSCQDMRKYSQFLCDGNLDSYFLERLSKISAKHRELVFETLDEFQRNKNMNFTCIFPSPGCHVYDKYFEQPRPSNQLIHRYLFTKNELYTLTKQISDYLKQFDPQPTSERKSQEEQLTNLEEQSVTKLSDFNQSPRLANQKMDSLDEIEPEPKQKEQKKKVENSVPPQETIEKPKQQEQSEKQQEQIEIIDQSPIETPSQSREKKIIISPPSDQQCNQPKVDAVVKIQEEPEPQKVDELKPSRNIMPAITPCLDKSQPENSKQIVNSPKKSPAFTSNLSSKQQSEIIRKEKPLMSPNNQIRHNFMQDSFNISNKNSVMTPEKTNDGEEEVQSPQETKLPNLINIKSEASDEKKMPLRQVSKKSLKKANFGKRKSREGNANNTSHVEYRQQTAQNEETKSEFIPKTQSNKTSQKAPDDIELNFEDIKASGSNEAPNRADLTNEPSNLTTENTQEEKKKEKQKMVITGDDILIEYVTRIVKLLENYLKIYNLKSQDPLDRVDEFLPQTLRFTLEKFSRHKIWSNKFDTQELNMSLVSRLRMRQFEMIERRTKILKQTLKKNNPGLSQDEIDKDIENQDKTRERIVCRISSQKIEKMVKQSNEENKIDIVSILVEGCYILPPFIQTATGKTSINGTLTSLKLYEKLLKSEDFNKVIQLNMTIGGSNKAQQQFPLQSHINLSQTGILNYNKEFSKSETKKNNLILPYNQIHSAGTKLGMINKFNIARNLIANDQKNNISGDEKDKIINKFGLGAIKQPQQFFNGSVSGVSNTASSHKTNYNNQNNQYLPIGAYQTFNNSSQSQKGGIENLPNINDSSSSKSGQYFGQQLQQNKIKRIGIQNGQQIVLSASKTQNQNQSYYQYN